MCLEGEGAVPQAKRARSRSDAENSMAERIELNITARMEWR